MTNSDNEARLQARLILADEIKYRLRTCMTRTKEAMERGQVMDRQSGVWK